MRISDWSSDGCSSDLAGTMVEAVAPYRMGVAEPAHREDRSRRDQRQAASAAEVGVEPRDAPRAGGPLDGKGRAVEMLFGPSLACDVADDHGTPVPRSEEHTSELQSLMRISYAVFCLTKKKKINNTNI